MNSELIDKLKNGDINSQKQIYLEYKDKIYTFCFLHVKNHDDAEDLTHEIFIKIFKAITKYRKGNFSAWVFRITANHIINAITRKKYYQSLEDYTVISKEKNTDQSIEIERTLRKMPSRLSLLLVLREKEGLNYKELSEIFGVPMGTISSRLAKAREVFRKHYGGKVD